MTVSWPLGEGYFGVVVGGGGWLSKSNRIVLRILIGKHKGRHLWWLGAHTHTHPPNVGRVCKRAFTSAKWLQAAAVLSHDLPGSWRTINYQLMILRSYSAL